MTSRGSSTGHSARPSPAASPRAPLALDDPAGITSDLAALLDVREQEFNQREDIRRSYVTAGIINVAPDDPHVRNRQTEPPLTAKEILWPLLCFVLGWAEVLAILYFCFRGYF